MKSCPAPHKIEAFGGTIKVRWEEDAGVSMHGGLAYFIEFLKISGLWEKFIQERPLKFTSPNAATQSEIPGTILFSVLSGTAVTSILRASEATTYCRGYWVLNVSSARTVCGGPLRSRTIKR